LSRFTWEIRVNIYLSVDGGYTFDTLLAANTANDGVQIVLIPPGLSTSTARIKVAAANSIYFDINDITFDIDLACAYTCGDHDGL